ncbi:MAG: lipopolysaccharide heptosyltransferase II, partial [Bryobacteraceae bacterium]|nr:lipopolysaccharide heptosyltransferase II [Bryobacteraceae bacterium]
MCIPALRALRRRFPDAHIAIQARPWVAELYAREKYIDRVLLCPPTRKGFRFLFDRWRAARQLRREDFDCAILLPNSFESALLVWLARIPRRAGYSRDARGLLLTDKVSPPAPGEIPRHERFYYLELLRRADLLGEDPPADKILLDVAAEARQAGLERFQAMGIQGPVVGVSPGAAYGGAKRWLPEYFAEAAAE